MEGTPYMEDKEIVDGEDSEEQQELKDYKEHQTDLTFEVDESKIPAGGKIVICNTDTPQALMKIVLDEDLEDIGKVTAKFPNEKIVRNQVKDVLTFHVSKGMLILMI